MVRVKESVVMDSREGVKKEPDGDEACRGIGNIVGVMEDEFSHLAVDLNGSNTKGIHQSPHPGNRVRGDRT